MGFCGVQARPFYVALFFLGSFGTRIQLMRSNVKVPAQRRLDGGKWAHVWILRNCWPHFWCLMAHLSSMHQWFEVQKTIMIQNTITRTQKRKKKRRNVMIQLTRQVHCLPFFNNFCSILLFYRSSTCKFMFFFFFLQSHSNYNFIGCLQIRDSTSSN